MRGDPQYEGTSFESRFIQSEREYSLWKATMRCLRLERRDLCRCRVLDVLPAVVTGEVSLRWD